VLPVAHHFLAKPCDGETLKAAIDRSCRLQSILSDERIRQAVGRINTLPSLPRLCTELNALIANPEVSLLQVSRLIEQDPAMVAKVLHLSNSSFFGLSRRLTSIREAVSCLGLSLLRNLIFSVAVFRAFESDTPMPGFSHERLQAHALAVAHLAKRLCPAREHADDAFVAALLADVGQLVLATHLPVLFADLLGRARADGATLHGAEYERLGFSHAEVGAYLLGLWQLPYAVVEGVAHHHDASRIPPHRFIAADAAYIAHALMQSAAFAPRDPFELAVVPLDAGYLEALGVKDELPAWRAMADEVVKGSG
jgi:HD-like signal output (HDOD) protein